jgi:hypothetical protein
MTKPEVACCAEDKYAAGIRGTLRSKEACRDAVCPSQLLPVTLALWRCNEDTMHLNKHSTYRLERAQVVPARALEASRPSEVTTQSPSRVAEAHRLGIRSLDIPFVHTTPVSWHLRNLTYICTYIYYPKY